MKLYDKILRSSEHCIYEEDKVLREDLLNAHVFDVTNLIPLVGDWDTERIHPIPKRPPFDITWVEWNDCKHIETHYGKQIVDGVWGVLVMKISRETLYVSFPKIKAIVEPDLIFSPTFGMWDEFYVAKGFADIKSCTGGLYKLRLGLREDYCLSVYCLKNDSTEAVGISITTTFEQLEKEKQERKRPGIVETGAFGLCRLTSADKDKQLVPFIVVIPAFMSFALLHCRNVVTETVHVDKALQKATLKRGHPPLCVHHVIKLKLIDHKLSVKGEEGIVKETRMHMVRGHFKNLQHDKFRVKGWHW